MPGVPVPHNQQLQALLASYGMAIRALQTQQQATYSNGQGQAVINAGLSPGSNPAQYGLQLVSPSSGNEIGFFGEDADGNVGLTFRDSSGNVLVRIDVNGIHIYDSSGTEQARFGVLNTSPAIFGAGVRPYGGSELQQVGGALYGAITSASNVTASSWTAFSPAGSVTAEIGPSGEALVSVTARISTGTSNEVGRVGVAVDGGAPSGSAPVVDVSGSASSGISVSGAVQYVMTGLTVGTHSFAPNYLTANDSSSTCSFANVQLTVQPL